MSKFNLSLQWKFLLSITLIIFPTIGIIFIWEGMQHEKRAMDQIMNQARILSRQIVLTRQWISDCGGVMVDVKSEGARNTSYFLDDRLETSRGYYQRFTPSMVTKKLSQYSARQDLYQFRLASLKPINPENRPDDFERKALIEFSNEGTAIRIEVREDEDDVSVAVRDRGIGISEENMEVIFEKFYTLPSSKGMGKHEGTGLGLAICKGIIEAHGGRIWAESVKGEGSVFLFTLSKQRLVK